MMNRLLEGDGALLGGFAAFQSKSLSNFSDHDLVYQRSLNVNVALQVW
jgi:hypothetical protein